MELKVEIEFDALLQVIKDLPESQKSIVKKELDAVVKNEPINEKAVEKKMTREEYRNFLLNGPVMSDEEYREYKNTRKRMSKWRTT